MSSPTACRAARWTHAASAALVAVALLVWLGTGTEGYTRWPDERLAGADAPPAAGESDLLAEIGFVDARDESRVPEIHSRFALGLVPGGFDPPHLLSLATLVLAAILASSVAASRAVLARRRACGPASELGSTSR